jgi:hypothetical protein
VLQVVNIKPDIAYVWHSTWPDCSNGKWGEVKIYIQSCPCIHLFIIIIVVVVVGKDTISFMQGIYTYIT